MSQLSKNCCMEPGVAIDILLQERDKRGRLIKERNEVGHSFVGNFLKILFGMMHGTYNINSGGAALACQDTSNTTRTGIDLIIGSNIYYNMNCDAPVTDDTYGIVVGTGDTAPDIADYNLETKVLHGSGVAGKLNYADHSLVAPTYDESGGWSLCGLIRTFSNNSGGSIIIKEIGLISKMHFEHRSTYRYFLLIRDVLGSPFTVTNGNSVTVQYRIRCNV